MGDRNDEQNEVEELGYNNSSTNWGIGLNTSGREHIVEDSDGNRYDVHVHPGETPQEAFDRGDHSEPR